MVDYQSFISYSVHLAGMELQVVSKPGLPQWDQVTSSTSLIAEHIRLKKNDRLLIMGTHNGSGAVVLSRQNQIGETWLKDQSSIALECARRTLVANNIQNIQISQEITLLPEFKDHFDVVVIESPKGRLINRRWLVEAYTLLHSGGALYLAGSNDLGIQSIARDAGELFGNTRILDYKKGARIVQLVKTSRTNREPTWSTEPGIAPDTWITYPMQVNKRMLTIHLLPGVFSLAGLDDGTSLLLEKIGTPDASRILDVGCGCGVIGLVLAQRLQEINRSYSIDMVDSDLYAVASARKNITESRLINIQTFPSDLLQAVEKNKYELIVSNPPFHAGKEVNYMISEAMILQSHRALDMGGQLTLVANSFIRYEKMLEKYFRVVDIVAQNNRFRLITALK